MTAGNKNLIWLLKMPNGGSSSVQRQAFCVQWYADIENRQKKYIWCRKSNYKFANCTGPPLGLTIGEKERAHK